jgi:hypothetical protein
MKNHICDTCKMNMELVPLGCHRQNAAEVAICNFKSHFLGVLAGVADDFPQHLWYWLLPQTEITLNLIRQSNATPIVSAYAHLRGPFDYNKCCLHQWDVRHKSTRRPTSKGHGHTIQLTCGISSPPQNIIAHTSVMSRPPKANVIRTQSISNIKT